MECVSSEGTEFLRNNIGSKLSSQNKYKLIATCFQIKVDNIPAERASISILIPVGKESRKVLILRILIKTETLNLSDRQINGTPLLVPRAPGSGTCWFAPTRGEHQPGAQGGGRSPLA